MCVYIYIYIERERERERERQLNYDRPFTLRCITNPISKLLKYDKKRVLETLKCNRKKVQLVTMYMKTLLYYQTSRKS